MIKINKKLFDNWIKYDVTFDVPGFNCRLIFGGALNPVIPVVTLLELLAMFVVDAVDSAIVFGLSFRFTTGASV